MDARVSAPRQRGISLFARHLANFGPLLVIAVGALVLACDRVHSAAPGTLRLLYGGVVALNALALAMSTWSSVLGAAVLIARRFGLAAAGPVLAPPTGRARTAILIAIHEEDSARVFATARAIADDAIGIGIGVLDVFVLSDSQSAAATQAESAMTALVAREAPNRLFYRRRIPNTGRKPGNIADFVQRWGAAYDFMVLLDADSLMTGACIARLVGIMEANPRAGLIQTMSYAVGRQTLFARCQQFGSRLMSPVFQVGVAFWQGPRGNYWGHNAIIRTASFAAHCGLPTLPGPPPLGGEILSHDTVEAALMLRGGADVWMLPEGPDGQPDESWEETPTNLLDHLERDRRWLRGNLQHIHVLTASGLKTASYYHLVRGLSHFLYAPLLVVWVVLFVAIDRHTILDGLTCLFLALVLAPRLIGLVAALSSWEQVEAVGGRSRLVGSALAEGLVSALFYPVVVVSHIQAFAALATRTEARWDSQARQDRGLRLGEAVRRFGGPICIACAALLAAVPLSPLPALLFGPGLILGIPLAVVSSRRAGRRLFDIPEDATQHPLRRVQRTLEAHLRAGVPLDGGAAQLALPPECPIDMPKQKLNDRM